jgi:hypothetical protein
VILESGLDLGAWRVDWAGSAGLGPALVFGVAADAGWTKGADGFCFSLLDAATDVLRFEDVFALPAILAF